ncbi:MAG: ATP synthase F0 subunit C [Bdellovibrionales bacterium]|nr:ATP synthase F0 subunit C [Bdellovibrionales bacterium]
MKKNIINIASAAIVVLAFVSPAFAETAAGVAGGTVGLIGLGAGLGMGLAAFGGALGQGKAVSAALDAIGRNPSASGNIFTPMILGLVFMETLVIFTMVIAYMLQGKI